MEAINRFAPLTQQVDPKYATHICNKSHATMLRYHFCQGLWPLAASDALPGTMRFPANSVFN